MKGGVRVLRVKFDGLVVVSYGGLCVVGLRNAVVAHLEIFLGIFLQILALLV